MRSWKIETNDGTIITMELPSFRQVILNPDGSPGAPVPLDNNAVELKTATGVVMFSDSEIETGERLNGDFRFKTATGQYVGIPVMTGISKLVVTGIVGNNSTAIEFEQILRFEAT